MDTDTQIEALQHKNRHKNKNKAQIKQNICEY